MLLSENIIASMNRNRKETGIYDEIRTLLTKAGKDVVDFSGIISNPTYAKEIEYLKAKDKKMAYVIDRIGHIDREVDKKTFEKYRRKFSPYNSVASLYFWAVAGGVVPELRDY